MGAARCRSIGATVLCIAAVVAAPTELSAATPTETSAKVVAPAADLGPVTDHEIEAPVPVQPAGSTMTQVVSVSVIGGDLTLGTHQAEVVLHRGPWSIWTGELPSVQVIDARGTHAGWIVRWSVAEVIATEGGSARKLGSRTAAWVAPSDPVVVFGVPDGITAGGHGRVLFAAEPGGGGGTYEVGARVAALIPSTLDLSEVVVQLTFTLG